jgi:hypothetical protein
MATTSTIIPAKLAIVSSLKARPALTGVLISYADPGDKSRREQIFCSEVRVSEQSPVALKTGRRKRDEEYEIDVIVDCYSKTTPSSAETRCMEMVAELEDELADDTTIQGTDGILWATVTDMRLRTTETGDGPYARAIITITVRGRLT